MSELEIPEGWEKVSIKSISSLITKGSTPTTYGYSFTPDGIPFLRAENVLENKLNLQLTKFISKETHDFLKRSKIKSGDVLLTIAGTIGRSAFVPKNSPEFNSNQAVAIIRLSNDCIPKFLSYFLNSNLAKTQITSSKVTTSIPNLSLEMIGKLILSLPPLETQKKIVQKLDDVLSKLEEKKKQILELNTAEKLTVFLESNKFSILKLIRTGFFAEDNWEDYPKIKIGEITKVTSGSTPARDNSGYWNGEIPWLKSGELLDGEIDGSDEHITKKSLSDSSAKLFPKDTVLVALYGQGKTRGKTGLLLIEASTNQAVCGIFPNSTFLSEYVQFWIRSMYLELRKTAVGGAQPNWNTTTIKEIEIILPSLDEQKNIMIKIKKKLLEINNFEKRIKDIIEQKNHNLKYINQIPLSVLDSAFSGKLIS